MTDTLLNNWTCSPFAKFHKPHCLLWSVSSILVLSSTGVNYEMHHACADVISGVDICSKDVGEIF